MQACLARLYTDRDFREAASASRDVVSASYQLTTRERNALHALDRDALAVVAAVVEQKRQERLEQHFAATASLTPSILSQTIDRYCRLHTQRSRLH